jgi:hypothetical protein
MREALPSGGYVLDFPNGDTALLHRTARGYVITHPSGATSTWDVTGIALCLARDDAAQTHRELNALVDFEDQA